jgi:hypothetical protein
VKVIACVPPAPRFENWSQQGLNRTIDTARIALRTGVGVLLLKLPVGFFSDGASVPNILWGVLDATPVQLETMALFHDAAYRSDAEWELLDGTRRPIVRSAADGMAEAIALWSGASWLDGQKIRYGLAVGGGASWQKKRLDWHP